MNRRRLAGDAGAATFAGLGVWIVLRMRRLDPALQGKTQPRCILPWLL